MQNNYFATKQQELLLKAALLDGSDAINAWERWKTISDFEGELDNGQFRLLPLVYKNLHRHKVEDQYMNKLKGTYRLSWSKNQRLFHQITDTFKNLHNEGVKTMILAGALLTLLHYRDYGARPMTNVAVLVPASQASRAAELLVLSGWRPTSNSLESDLHYQHSAQFKKQTDQELDFHWHLFYGRRRDSFDFWDNAIPVQFNGISTHSLCATDALLHTIIHGVSWGTEHSIRWIADAMAILHSSKDTIDWTRLKSLALKHQSGLRLKVGLRYLYSKFKARIPNVSITDIKNIPASRLEWIEYWYQIRGREALGKSPLGGLPYWVVRYLLMTSDSGIMCKTAGLPKYLKYHLSANNLQKPTLLFFKILWRVHNEIFLRSSLNN